MAQSRLEKIEDELFLGFVGIYLKLDDLARIKRVSKKFQQLLNSNKARPLFKEIFKRHGTTLAQVHRFQLDNQIELKRSADEVSIDLTQLEQENLNQLQAVVFQLESKEPVLNEAVHTIENVRFAPPASIRCCNRFISARQINRLTLLGDIGALLLAVLGTITGLERNMAYEDWVPFSAFFALIGFFGLYMFCRDRSLINTMDRVDRLIDERGALLDTAPSVSLDTSRAIVSEPDDEDATHTAYQSI